MKKTIALILAALLALCALAGCGSSGGGSSSTVEPGDFGVTWDDYIDWLAETFGANSPDPDDYRAMLAQAKSWDDVDVSSPPWDRLFSEDGFDASTWDEFVAAGGVGTYNEDFEDSALTGSGEPTGEPTEEPPES